MDPNLLFHLKSLTRCIYYVAEEEDRFLSKLADVLKKYEDHTFVYNGIFGLVPIKQLIRSWTTRSVPENRDTQNIHDALAKIYTDDPQNGQHFYIITDPERWLPDPQVQRRVLNIFHQLHNDDRTIKVLIFVGNRLVIPPKLQRYIEVIHDKGLTEDEISGLVQEVSQKLQIKPPKDVTRMFRGLTSYEADAAIAQSIIRTKRDSNAKRIDPKVIADFKRRQLAKTDLLDYVDVSPFTFDVVGGNDQFKEWSDKTKAAWTDEGQNFGLRPPKGVLAVGVWGCGKSLSVKAMGNAWKLPVIQLEMGRLRSSAVGESEANVYRAINLIESVAPCVTGDTEVTLADGSTQPIEELWQDPPENFEVMCWNEKTLKVETTKVAAITRREAEAFRVEAANGFRLDATANHLHYVMRGAMPEWVRTDELEPGDMLAVPLFRYKGNDDCTRFHPPGMRLYHREDGLQDFRRGHGGFTDSVVPTLPVKWTPELGWLLGVIEGDGFIGARNGIGLTNTSIGLLNDFEQVLMHLFGLGAVRRQHVNEEVPDLPGLSKEPEFQPCWTTKVQNQLAAEFLHSARAAILTAPVQVRAAFLAGWLDADGCIRPDKVTLTVKGAKLRKERRKLARQMVQSLGVTPSKFGSANMEITGSRAKQLAGMLVEYLHLKGVRAGKVTSSDTGFDRGMGFACGVMLHSARKALPISEIQKAGVSTGVMWRHENGTTPISERYMNKYADLVGKEQPDFQRLLEADCRWVEIRKIASVGQQVVYDLACEGDDTHSFFANGLITHNCVVWLDEAEKSLSGGQSSAMSDAGTTSRVIGILSNWLQETTAQVCLALTANSLKTLPVEFVNRMDERFFFDLPSEEERVEILKIHLRKRGQDPANFQLAELAEHAVNMVGREIEQAIGAALIESFHAGCEALSPEILAKELQSKPRIFKTMVDELKEVLDWVGYDPDIGDGIRARFASKRRSETFKNFRGSE